MSNQKYKYDVFISYSTADQKVVEGICGYLERNNYRCFVAYRDISPSEVWAKAIAEAIDVSRMMIAVFSENFNISVQTDREIELAAEKKIPILTFRISESQFTGAKKYYLKNINWIDAFPNPEKAFGQLFDNVKKLLGNADGDQAEICKREEEERIRREREEEERKRREEEEKEKARLQRRERRRQWLRRHRGWLFGMPASVLMTVEVCLGSLWYVPNFNTEDFAATGTVVEYPYVDLGLSVKWATCNVGATNPEDYGGYYAWGETETKREYTSENSRTFGKPMSDISGDSRYDVARARWGGSWRMPTKSELEELLDRCKWKFGKLNGMEGFKVTGPNGNSIFLPAAGYRDGSDLDRVGLNGYYWSSTPDEFYDYYAYYLIFGGKDQDVNWGYRNNGRSVRPVSE